MRGPTALNPQAAHWPSKSIMQCLQLGHSRTLLPRLSAVHRHQPERATCPGPQTLRQLQETAVHTRGQVANASASSYSCISCRLHSTAQPLLCHSVKHLLDRTSNPHGTVCSHNLSNEQPSSVELLLQPLTDSGQCVE